MYETFLKAQPYRGRLHSIKPYGPWRSVTNTGLCVTQDVGKFLTGYVTIRFSRRLLWNEFVQAVTLRTCISMVLGSNLSQDTDHSQIFMWLTSVLPRTFWDSIFDIHHLISTSVSVHFHCHPLNRCSSLSNKHVGLLH